MSDNTIRTSANTIRTLSLTEMDNVHRWQRTLFESFGIRGPELDEAIAATFRPAWQAIDAHRLCKQEQETEKQERRSHLKLVVSNEAEECD